MSSIATLTLIHSPSLVRAYEICVCVLLFQNVLVMVGDQEQVNCGESLE